MKKMTKKKLVPLCILLPCMVFASGARLLADELPDEVKSVNHRGYNTVAPENTLPAFELSKENGFHYVETDISFTKDNVPVLLHDDTINRTARNEDGSELEKDISISSITYEEALSYDFGIWKDEAYKGTKIPTLESFLKFCKENSLHPYLELKENGEYTHDQVNDLIKMVQEEEMQDNVTWISFSYDYLEWVRDEEPNARLGLLSLWISPDFNALLYPRALDLKTETNEVFLDINTDIEAEGIAACKEAGLPLEVYMLEGMESVDETEIMKQLDPYISGVTSDVVRYEDVRQ